MGDQMHRYEELRDRGLQYRQLGLYDLGDALLELARLVLVGHEKAAADALRRLPLERDEPVTKHVPPHMRAAEG